MAAPAACCHGDEGVGLTGDLGEAGSWEDGVGEPRGEGTGAEPNQEGLNCSLGVGHKCV